MTCTETRAIILKTLNGNGGPLGCTRAERWAVRGHFDGCKRCNAWLDKRQRAAAAKMPPETRAEILARKIKVALLELSDLQDGEIQ